MSGTPPARQPDVETLRQVFREITALDAKAADTARLRRIRELCPAVEDWRRLLAAIPPDKLSFQLDVGVQRLRAVDSLTRWCGNFKTGRVGGHTRRDAETHGYLSVLLMTLITMEDSARSGNGPGGKPEAHDCDGLCRQLVRDASVRAALLGLYAPDAGDRSDERAVREWQRIREAELEFHRHGSTSFILRGLPDESAGRRIRFALKCVLFPYSKIPVIAEKTRTYARDHNALDVDGRPVQHMVRVWASTSHWILMDFAEGNTLAEEIQRIKDDSATVALGWRRAPVRSPAGNVRLDMIRKIGLPLVTALAELHSRDKRHEDLSPTNIIVRRRDPGAGGGEYDVTFVDFGRNYLYSGAVGGLESGQGVYVAPEVRENGDDVTKADVYSLGRILIALGDVGENRDGTIPDRFYGQAPLLARFIEDLIDVRPQRRLLVFPIAADDPDVYRVLGQVLAQELDVTQAALVEDPQLRPHAIPDDRQSVVAMLSSLFPPSREPKKRRRIYRLRKAQGVLADPRRSMHARWLLTFSVLSSISFALSLTVCVYWFLRDIGIDVLGPADQLVLRLLGARPDVIPLLDDLRRPGYELGRVWENLPARIIGVSFALASARYYQNILSGLTTRVADSPGAPRPVLRFGAELWMRIMSIWASWLILGVNLVDVRWWPIGTAVGYTGVLFSNILCARFATEQLARARRHGLSTVPPEHQKITGLDGFRQWGPTITFYAITVWTFAVLIVQGVLNDTYVYAAAVALVNIGLFYVIKTGVNALDVRTGLNRCFLAAERLRYEADRDRRLLLPADRPRPVLADMG